MGENRVLWGWERWQWFRCTCGCDSPIYGGGTTTSGYKTCPRSGRFAFQEPLSFSVAKGGFYPSGDPDAPTLPPMGAQ